MDVPDFEVGEKAQWIVGMPSYELDDCEIVAKHDDGTYTVKYQVWGQGPWHTGTADPRKVRKIGMLVKKRQE